MIYLEPKYQPCMDALLPVEWSYYDSGMEETLRYRITGEQVRDKWQCETLTISPPGYWRDAYLQAPEVVACILERAAREWLHSRNVYVVPTMDRHGLTQNYVAYQWPDCEGGYNEPCRVPPVGSYAEAQLEAMLAVIGDSA